MKKHEGFYVLSFADLVADVMIKIPRLPVEPAAHQAVSHIGLEPGGAGNFLIAGQRLGLSMGSVSVVGSDAFGTEIISIIQSEGVDVEGIIYQGKEGTSTVFVLMDDNKQHVYLGKYGAGEDVYLNDQWKDKIQQAGITQFWGYSFMEKRISSALIEAVEYASARACLISFDPGPLFSEVSDEHRQLFLSRSNIVLLTEEEIPSILGAGAGLADAANILIHGPDVVCVKRGSQGCTVFSRQGQVSHPGYPVEVRDTSAAGDAFNAAFLFGYLHRWPMAQTAAFANAMGAAKVQKPGSGRSVPTKNEIIEILHTYHEVIPGFP